MTDLGLWAGVLLSQYLDMGLSLKLLGWSMFCPLYLNAGTLCGLLCLCSFFNKSEWRLSGFPVERTRLFFAWSCLSFSSRKELVFADSIPAPAAAALGCAPPGVAGAVPAGQHLLL